MKVEWESKMLDLAASVSDGVRVDWPQVELSASDEGVRRRQLSLKTIALIADLHRTLTPAPVVAGLRYWRHLEIRGKIGKGNFGEVYRAWDPNLRREVALKLTTSGGQQQMAAMKEARALASVKHNNVVTVHGVDRQGDQVGLWMDLIRGRTLAAIVKDHGPLGGREAALVGIELCRALAAVHAKGLAHGDVKAQNVMREAGGRIVLMDFGLVRRAKETDSGRSGWAGTPAYMAPELFRRECPSVESDIFATGVLLYYLVSGTFPTPRDRRDAQKTVANARLLHDARPDLPENFVQLIERALAPAPEDRFGTAGEMLNALSGTLTAERHSKAPQRAWRFFPRLIGPALALVMLALLTVFAQPAARTSVVDWVAGIATAGRPQASIAVLPFENDGSPESDDLSEGIASDVTSRLIRAKKLRVVVVDNSVRRLKNRDDLAEVGRRLRVKTLLLGTFHKDGDSIRLAVKLVDAESNSYLWSETYERRAQSVHEFGMDIARDVVLQGLARQYAGLQLPEGRSGSTASAVAYQLYVRGRFYWNKRTPEQIRKAITYFEDAVKADPDYALAYSGLADCYSTLVDYGNMSSWEGLPQAKAAAARGLQLDSSLAETNMSFARVRETDWDWASAEASFRQALRLSPGNALAHTWYARFLANIAHVDAAVFEARQAVDLDPLSLPANSALGGDLYFARQYDQAREQLQKTLDLDGSFMPAHFWLGRVYIQQGRFVEALTESKASSAAADRQLLELLAAETYAAQGQRKEALEIVEEWKARRAKSLNVAASSFAVVYSNLRDKEATLEWLERALAERDPSLLTARKHPGFDWLRNDAQFEETFRKMGLPFKSTRRPGPPY